MEEKYKNIRICNNFNKEIKSDLIKSDILKLLDQNIYLKKKKIISEDDIEILKENNHPIMIELNSYRILLFLTIYQNKKYCILIDQNIPNKIKMILVKLRFSEELYNNTLLEGEIVLNKNNKWEILIYDLHLLKGEKIESSFLERIDIIDNLLKNNYTYDSYMQICGIKRKSIYKFKDIIPLFNNKLHNYNYLVTGICFVNDENYLLINLHNKIYQNDEDNEKDNISKNNKKFEIKQTSLPDIYELYENDLKIGIASISTIEISNLCNEIFEKNKNKKIIFDCKYNNNFNKWEPINFINSI
jgi:hypothetical protein